jgi:hypothetical protein
MTKIKNTLIAGALVSALVFAFSDWSTARVDKNTRLRARLKKADIVDIVSVGYNNWNYQMRNQGSYFYDAPNSNPGGEFPRGSGNTIVFAAGLYVGTLKNGVPVVSETEFSPEFQPGRIENSNVPFDELTAEDPTRGDLQVYLIDRSASGSDYSNWPADAPTTALGQPGLIADAQTWAVFNDLDLTLSQEGTSISPDPGLGLEIVLESFAFNAGPLSDVVYCKFTIKNKTSVNYVNSYLGMWMDADVDANNATNDIVGIDTVRGLGFVYNADNSDFPGAVGFDFLQGPVVDTTTVDAKLVSKFRDNKVTLVYNKTENRYIPTTLPGNQIWLGATSFNTYANGTDPQNNEQRYNLLAGRFADGNPKAGTGVSDYYAFRGDPVTGLPPADVATSANQADQRILHGVGPFVIDAGSAQEVWVGIVGAQGTDRLNAIVNMRATDDLAQATFEAGLIAPVPPSVPKIKVIGMDGRVNITWDNSSEFSEDIAGEILGISEANGYVVADENSPDDDHDGNPDGFTEYLKQDFQGYEIVKSRTGLQGSFTTLARYDKVDGFQTVRNQRLNTAGRLVIEDVIVGTNTGLKYFFEDTDVINGQTYFYAVKAFDAQPYVANGNNPFVDPDYGTINGPAGLPISLETAPTANVVSVIPMMIPDMNQSAGAQDTASHIAGVSDGFILPHVVDPAAVTGDQYRVEFFAIPDSVGNAPLVHDHIGTLAYRLINLRTNAVVPFTNRIDDINTFVDINGNGVFNSGDQVYDDRLYHTTIAIPDADDSDEEFGIADGVLIRVFGPPPSVQRATYVPGPQYQALGVTGTRGWMDEINFGGSSPRGGIDYGTNGFLASGSNVTPDQWKHVDVVFSRDSTKWSYAYAGNGNSPTPMYGVIRVPFQAFEVDPTDGDPTPRRLAIFAQDQNRLGFWIPRPNSGNTPPPAVGGPGPQSRTYLFIQNDNYDFPSPANLFTIGTSGPRGNANTNNLYNIAFGYGTLDADESGLADGHEWHAIANRIVNAASVGGATATYEEIDTLYRSIPDEGTYRILANHVTLEADVWTFTTSSLTAKTKAQKKSGLDNIRAVPNPYYGQSLYQTQGLFGKVLKFTHLPGSCTIKIYNVAGDLVTTLTHNASSINGRLNTNPLDLNATAAPKETSEEWWDLTNADGKFVASGMYIALIDVPGVGKKTVKFAVIQEANITNGPEIR